MLNSALTHALLLISIVFPAGLASRCPSANELNDNLGKRLSLGSSITNHTASAPRWSLYHAPRPAIVVNVALESDVASTVQYCNKNNITFLAQSQGNGWADTFRLGDCGLLINIAGLNKVAFNRKRTIATIGGGALVNDMVVEAYNSGTRFANPTCTCLGYLGAMLGGGLTRSMGLDGAGVDQLLQAKLVTATGELLRVDAKHHPDLWYAIRGAAPNFGIVTSALVKAYPVPKAQNIAWLGAVTFSEDKLEALIEAVFSLDLKPTMEIDLLISTGGPPSNKPMIMAIPFFLGNASQGEEAFAPVLKVGPTSTEVKEVPYDRWGDFSKSFCVKGQRKPVYGASVSRQSLNPTTWRAIYHEFTTFVAAYPQAAGSTILAEYYPVQKAVAIGGATSSYPFRNVPIHVVTIPLYSDSKLDPAANAFGSRVRHLLRSADGLEENSTYINFAHGDEPLETIYGDNLKRLQALKRRYDPRNRFNQWFPLL